MVVSNIFFDEKVTGPVGGITGAVMLQTNIMDSATNAAIGTLVGILITSIYKMVVKKWFNK